MFIFKFLLDLVIRAWNLHWSIPVVLGLLLIFFLTNWAVQRRPEVIANGYMDYEKGKEIAPTVFKGGKEKSNDSKGSRDN